MGQCRYYRHCFLSESAFCDDLAVMCFLVITSRQREATPDLDRALGLVLSTKA
jgi:hypothetical protein